MIIVYVHNECFVKKSRKICTANDSLFVDAYFPAAPQSIGGNYPNPNIVWKRLQKEGVIARVTVGSLVAVSTMLWKLSFHLLSKLLLKNQHFR